MRIYLMAAHEQKNFDPAQFTRNLKAAGFKVDSEVCPVKITEPWDRLKLDHGAILYRQWEVS